MEILQHGATRGTTVSCQRLQVDVGKVILIECGLFPSAETSGAARRLLGKRQSDCICSCYDEGKRCAETLFFNDHRQHGLDIKVARTFNTHGPRMHPNDGRVISNFIVLALKG